MNSCHVEFTITKAEVLKQNNTLQSLTMHCDKMGDEAGIALAESLKHNTTLQSLTMHSYKMGERGRDRAGRVAQARFF